MRTSARAVDETSKKLFPRESQGEQNIRAKNIVNFILIGKSNSLKNKFASDSKRLQVRSHRPRNLLSFTWRANMILRIHESFQLDSLQKSGHERGLISIDDDSGTFGKKTSATDRSRTSDDPGLRCRLLRHIGAYGMSPLPR